MMGTIVTSAIALIGIYITGALLASWLNEQFATFVALRSKTLVGGVREMVGSDASDLIFAHPLIASLGEPIVPSPGAFIAETLATIGSFLAKLIGVKWLDMPITVGKRRIPPYISADHFASVVADIVRVAAPGSAQASALASARNDIEAGLSALATNVALAPLHTALAPIWREARGDYDAFVASIASWYDAHMDRMTGWYKRNVQIILLAITGVTVTAANLDSIRMWHELQKNIALTSALADATQAYYHASTTVGKPPALVPTCSNAADPKSCACPLGFEARSTTTCAIDATVATTLPIWWGPEQREALAWRDSATGFFQAWGTKIIGLSLTIAALMLGAPFWFDLLGTIVNVRSIGTPPGPATPQR